MSYRLISHTNFSLVASQTQSYFSSKSHYSPELLKAISLIEESLSFSQVKDPYTTWMASDAIESDLSDSEKIDFLGLLLFFFETQPAFIEQIFNDPRLTLFEKIKKDWLDNWKKWGALHKSCLPKETQKNIPSTRFVFLLRDLSKLVFSNTGKINKGGIATAQALFNSELGCLLSSEHRTQILKILKILSEDEVFQAKLEEKRLPHPKMKTLIQTSLKIDLMHPIGHVEMVRTLLGLFFLDHRQLERQNSCYCFGAFIFLLNDHPHWVAETALAILESGKVTFRNPNVLWMAGDGIFYLQPSDLPFDACDLWLLHPGRTQGLNCEIPIEKMNQFPTFILGLQPIHTSIKLPLPRKAVKATLGTMYRQVVQTVFSQVQEKKFETQCIESAERTVTYLERDPLYQLFTTLMRFSLFNFVQESKIKQFLFSLSNDFTHPYLLKIRDTDQKTFGLGVTFIQHFNNLLKQEFWLLDVDASPLEHAPDAVLLKEEDNFRKYQGNPELLSVLFKLLSSPSKLIHFDVGSKQLYFVESFEQLQKILCSIGEKAMSKIERYNSQNTIQGHWKEYLVSGDSKKQLLKFFAKWNKEVGLANASVELFEVLDAPYLYHTGGVTSTLLNHLGFFFHTCEFTFSGVEEFLINLQRILLNRLSPQAIQSYLYQERALLGTLSNNTTGHTFTYYPHRFPELWFLSPNGYHFLNDIFYHRGIKILEKKLTVEERQKFLDTLYEKNGIFRPSNSWFLLEASNAQASVFFRKVKEQIQAFHTLHPFLLEMAEGHFQTLLQKISCQTFIDYHLTDLLLKLIPNELNTDTYLKIANEMENSFAHYPDMDPLLLSYRMQKILSEITKRFYEPYVIEKMICNQMGFPLTLDLADLNWRSGARERPDHQKAVVKYHYPTACLAFYIRKGKKEELMQNQLFNLYKKAIFFFETSQPIQSLMFPVTKKA